MQNIKWLYLYCKKYGLRWLLCCLSMAIAVVCMCLISYISYVVQNALLEQVSLMGTDLLMGYLDRTDGLLDTFVEDIEQYGKVDRYSFVGNDVFYYKTTLTQYNYIFPDFKQTKPYQRNYDKRSKYTIREIFRVLSDEDNYPIYFHCNAGADRTGTVAFLINGVLGVPYKDLTRDFELTSFSSSGNRYRSKIENGAFTEDGVMQDDMGNYVAWDKMYQTMMADYGTEGGTLASAIENYLVTVCKVKEQDIETLKSIMLE